MKTKFLISTLCLAFISLAHATNTNSTDGLTDEQRQIVRALQTALDNTNFPDCRIETNGSGLSFEHGDITAWINYWDERSDVSVNGNHVTVQNSTHYDDNSGDLDQNQVIFTLSANQQEIVAATFVESELDRVNVGTITQPVFSYKATELQRIRCLTAP